MVVADMYLSALGRIEGKVDDINDKFTALQVEMAQEYVTKREYESNRDSEAKKRRALTGALATVAAAVVGLAGDMLGIL